MLQAVQNEGGRASCQDDFQTFRIMRESQFRAWNEEMLSSYLLDVVHADESGRNLLEEKYARMMQFTAPLSYEALASCLPIISDSKKEMVEEIVQVQSRWQAELHRQYPRISSRSRPVDGHEDTVGQTSFETYLRGELLTYSLPTLQSYRDHVRELDAQGLNMNRQIMDEMVRLHGYPSLDDAERRLQ